MPRFFFDFAENGVAHPDYEGTDLPDLEQARLEALDMLRDIAKDELAVGDAKHFVIAVRDSKGCPQITVSLSLTVARTAPDPSP
jgi:uncharacterized protein DUF6894